MSSRAPSLVAALLLVTPALFTQDVPERIGGIRFTADLEAALAASRQDGKPVIAYFTFDT